MKEIDIISASADGPVTLQSLYQNFTDLGVQPGDTLLVHSSLSRLGWVCGGAHTVVLALEEALGHNGTLVMPAFSGDLSDPSGWQNPPVPAEWWDTIVDQMPAFDPDLTSVRGMGAIPELFRRQPGTIRSPHPQLSFAARGPFAPEICGSHPLDFGFGEDSPLRKLYDLRAKILLLGTKFSNCTAFHLGEYRVLRGGPYVKCSSPVLEKGRRKWRHYSDIDYNASDFDRIGKDFEKRGGVTAGRTGYCVSKVCDIKDAVDFAQDWINTNRRTGNDQ